MLCVNNVDICIQPLFRSVIVGYPSHADFFAYSTATQRLPGHCEIFD